MEVKSIFLGNHSTLYLNPNIDKHLFLNILRIGHINPIDIYNFSLINKSIYILLKSKEAKEYFLKCIPEQFSLLKTGNSILRYLMKKHKEQYAKHNSKYVTHYQISDKRELPKPEFRWNDRGYEYSPLLFSQNGEHIIYLSVNFTEYVNMNDESEHIKQVIYSISITDELEYSLHHKELKRPLGIILDMICTKENEMVISQYIDNHILPNNAIHNKVIQNLHEIKKSEVVLKKAFSFDNHTTIHNGVVNAYKYVQIKWFDYENQNIYWHIPPERGEKLYINKETSQFIDDTYTEHPYFLSITNQEFIHTKN